MFSAKPTSKKTLKVHINLQDQTCDLLKMLLKNKVTIECPRYTMQNQ